jgi:uncharacterized protein YceK
MRAALTAFLVVPLFLTGGCGSLSSHWNGRHGPYVGTKFDAEQVKRYTQEQEVGEGEVVAGLDIPLSFILDTLMLPYDLSVKKREASNQQASKSEPSTSALPKAESEARPPSEQQRPAPPVVAPPPVEPATLPPPPAQNVSEQEAAREALRKALPKE